MRHTPEELIAITLQYFPKGMDPDEPGYQQTPEVQRQTTARARASAQYDAFRAVLRRLAARFPGMGIENRSYSLQSPTGSGPDRCFDGLLDLPLRQPEERRRSLQFLISFVVPYYVICSLHGVPDGSPYPKLARSLEIASDEEPFVKAIAEEIETAFPGYEPMPAEVANMVVPEVLAGPGRPATITGCLFSDDWL
jgi:hypothetical protein